jgi:hypothetical protein
MELYNYSCVRRHGVQKGNFTITFTFIFNIIIIIIMVLEPGSSIAEKTKERWHGKRMHGQLLRNLDEKLVDIEQSYRWLKSGDMKGETESTIVAAQDQAISTNYFKNKILKEEIESECQLCKQHEETIEHLTSGCPILASEVDE